MLRLMTRTIIATLAVVGMAVTATPAMAQLKIEISGVGANQIPIAIAPFAGENGLPSEMTSIIRADLERSGLFRIVDASNTQLNENSTVVAGEWRAKGTDAITVGSVSRLADGRYDVRFRLHDVARQQVVGSQSIVMATSSLRLTAHRIADYIYEKLIGEPGIFATRIAYVTKSAGKYELQVADSDGQAPQSALVSREPIISPTWSPDGTKLAYVSFESRKPVIYVHSLQTGQRVPVANFKGSNSAPAWSPEGSRLAMVLTKDGNSQIYMANADGSGLRRLTQTLGIDTEPAFSPDGASIFFTSDRSGGPQIYRMGSDGSGAKRITFKTNYNISPRPSPDGKLLAYVTRRDGRFQIAVADLSSGEETILTDTVKDESPSFAPNNRYIMYATEQGGRGVLAVVSADGRIRQKISTAAGDVREPTWGPLIKF